MRWAGHVTNVEEDRNAYMILVEKYKGKSPLGRLGCRWQDNIQRDLKEGAGACAMDASGLGWRQVADCCEYSKKGRVLKEIRELLDS
jgi:hypothetical protein